MRGKNGAGGLRGDGLAVGLRHAVVPA